MYCFFINAKHIDTSVGEKELMDDREDSDNEYTNDDENFSDVENFSDDDMSEIKNIDKENEISKTILTYDIDLPIISYDHQRVINLFNAIPMEEKMRTRIYGYLEYIEKQINDIKKLQSREQPQLMKQPQSKELVKAYYGCMYDLILNIYNATASTCERISRYNIVFSNVIRRIIKNSINEFYDVLNQKIKCMIGYKYYDD